MAGQTEAKQLPNLTERQSGSVAFTKDTNAIIKVLNEQIVLPRHGAEPEGGAPFNGGAPAIVTGNRSAFGNYDCKITFWRGPAPTSGTYSASDLLDDDENFFPAVLINQGESGKATHYIGADAVVHAFPTGMFTEDEKPIFITNYTHAIRDIRLNLDTGWLQVTYNDSDDVPEEDWVNKIQLFFCESSGSS